MLSTGLAHYCQHALDAFATDTKAVSSYDTGLRLEPPLGNPADLAALRQGMRVGVLDARYYTYTYEEKNCRVAEAPAALLV